MGSKSNKALDLYVIVLLDCRGSGECTRLLNDNFYLEVKSRTVPLVRGGGLFRPDLTSEAALLNRREIPSSSDWVVRGLYT